MMSVEFPTYEDFWCLIKKPISTSQIQKLLWAVPLILKQTTGSATSLVTGKHERQNVLQPCGFEQS